MDDKIIKVMESAMKLFSKKGFESTSMQEIATECQMSKGSLYKCVDSKEDLLIQVFKYNHDKMVCKAKYIHADSSLAPKQRLKKMIEIEFGGMLENKYYLNLINNLMPTSKNKQFGPVMKRIKAEMMDWHKEILKQVYNQSSIDAYVWDVVLTLQGILKEFIQLSIQGNREIKSEQVADYVIFCLDAIVLRHDRWTPVFTENNMQEFNEVLKGQEPISIEKQVVNLLNQILNKLEAANLTSINKEDVKSTVALMKEEVQQNSPRHFLIKALVKNLESENEWEQEVKLIKNLLKIMQ